jgi:hypothetical protein
MQLSINFNEEQVKKLGEVVGQSKDLKRQAVEVFPNVRGFNKEEAQSYDKSLSKLFKKTGRRLF